MVSDGDVHERPLAKVSCRACGAVSHAKHPSREMIAGFYGPAYTLGKVAGSGEHARAALQAAFIQTRVTTTPRRVLEAGCGGGHLLEALASAWTECDFLGIEAAASLAQRHQAGRARVARGFLETHPTEPHPFDLILAINVIEHAASPGEFLAAIERQLAPDGDVVLVFPSSRANLELLFLDHIHTLTPAAINMLAGPTGLTVVDHGQVAVFGDFQFTQLRRGVSGTPLATVDPTDERTSYLETWSRLEVLLTERLATGPIYGFGAGEMAALLRAYAPSIFERVSAFIVDDVTGARDLGRPVKRLADVTPAETGALLLTAHPRAHLTLRARLSALGYAVITFDDLIPC
jgi:hypothetical protein